MDAKICDRCGKVIKRPEDITSLDLSFDEFHIMNWDICPVCKAALDSYIPKRILLWKVADATE